MGAAGPAHSVGPEGKAAAAAASKDLGEAKRLGAEADRLYAQGKYDEALPLAQRALSIQEKALGPEHPAVAGSCIGMALLCKAKGDYARAALFYERALPIQVKVLGPDHPAVAGSLNDLAALYKTKGDYARAEPLYQRVVAIREKALGPNHVDVAASLYSLALLYAATGDHARAETFGQRALAIREKALGPDHPDVANSLNDLAGVYWAKGDYGHAEPLYQRALAIREKALGPEHPDVAISVNNLAGLYQAKGDYARAEHLDQRALAIREKTLGPDHLDVVTSLDSLAVVYEDEGDYTRAEPLFQRALAIREKALSADHPHVAKSLSDLAALYVDKGDYARAEPLHQRALAIREKVLGPEHPDVARSLNDLAVLYDGKGDYARAEPLLQRALAIQEKALGHDHLDVATSLNNLAELYRQKGDYARAEPLYQRSLTIREKVLGPDHPDVATSLNSLAFLYVAKGHLPLAVRAARRAANIQDRSAAVLLTAGSEEQKLLYTNTLVGETYTDISLHVQHAPTDSNAARLALTVLLRRKGRILDTMTDSLAVLRSSLAARDQDLLDRLTSIYARLTLEVSRGPGKAPPDQYRKDLAALEQERQTLEADIGRRSAAFHDEQRLVTLPEVQAEIPAGAALVEIARYVPFEIQKDSPARRGAPRYVAYVLHPTEDPTFADLGEAAPLEAAVDTFRRALGDPDRTHDPKPAARALDRLLMEPIRALLGETRWVFLSPDAALNLVPFGALVDERGHYLVERYLFFYLTSGRDLLRLGDEPAPQREAPLILAAPAFDADGVPQGPEATHRDVRSLDMVTHALPPLESTAREARSIARLFPDSRVLLGAQATEKAVMAVHGPRLLHLATHGFFLPKQPLPDVLLHTPGADPTAAEKAALLQCESPLLRSGVALAGFNRRTSGSDAGVLTALEAAALDLNGTRLVVLSTCDSGLGQASAGEGVYGMRRALVMAGSETQVMSLWQVDTGRTREMMEAYYRRLKEGAGRSEAMRAVQLAMLADPGTAHPNLWASFIVSGEWRPLGEDLPLPEVGRVAPGVRGCTCGQAGGEPRRHGGWAAVALGLLATRRRARRSAASERRVGGLLQPGMGCSSNTLHPFATPGAVSRF
jgi:CHAT domain-containing protein/Tfp pilus assembly protein PilF